jgi:hypothetical protein
MTGTRRPGDYVRAFLTAARMTLRGEKHPAEVAADTYPLTLAWLDEVTAALNEVEAAARAGGFDPAGLTQHIEGRDVTARAIFAAIRFHAADEYPTLLKNPTGYSTLAIKATSLNDRYMLLRLGEAEALPPFMRESVTALAEILGRQPNE